eukprot:COSAG06_NODE_2139_length_7500_cov_3.787867_4_plen_76_part_00
MSEGAKMRRTQRVADCFAASTCYGMRVLRIVQYYRVAIACNQPSFKHNPAGGHMVSGISCVVPHQPAFSLTSYLP